MSKRAMRVVGVLVMIEEYDPPAGIQMVADELLVGL